jgi:hypothetical protein
LFMPLVSVFEVFFNHVKRAELTEWAGFWSYSFAVKGETLTTHLRSVVCFICIETKFWRNLRVKHRVSEYGKKKY